MTDKTPTPVSGIDGSAEPSDADLDALIADFGPTQGMRADSRDLSMNKLRALIRCSIARFGTRPAAEPPVIAAPVEAKRKKLLCRVINQAVETGVIDDADALFLINARFSPTLAEPAQQDTEESRCGNCGCVASEASMFLHEHDEEGDWFCSEECRDQHEELGCPHEHHNGYRHPKEAARLIACENVLRSLASYLGCGGYNAPEVDAAVFEEKIRYGIDSFATPPAEKQAAPSGEDFPYDRTFRAIQAATKLENGGTAIGVSVKAFQAEWDRLASQQSERQVLANVLALARVKWGNLDADANKVFAEAEAILAGQQSERPAPARFSCHLERDFGKAPCDHDCGKLRCMYPSKPAPAGQAVELRMALKRIAALDSYGPAAGEIARAALAASQAERPAVKEDKA
jgi:hypothetical protein